MNRVATSALLGSIALLVALLPLLTGQRFAFRDVSHFYLPLYDYVALRCHGEWLPLWNPLDHAGMPLIGESTTAVLYPVRYLIFALPLTAPVAMNVYLIVHVILAACGAGWLANRRSTNDSVHRERSRSQPRERGSIKCAGEAHAEALPLAALDPSHEREGFKAFGPPREEVVQLFSRWIRGIYFTLPLGESVVSATGEGFFRAVCVSKARDQHANARHSNPSPGLRARPSRKREGVKSNETLCFAVQQSCTTSVWEGFEASGPARVWEGFKAFGFVRGRHGAPRTSTHQLQLLAIAIAAISYSLSGSVFALCSNPPFLVGAAWLPFFLGATLFASDNSPAFRSRIAIATFSLTMMVLGGDPQMAFHAVLLASVVSVVRLSHREGRLQLKSGLIVVLAAVVLTVGMAMIQIAASVDWSRISDRVLSPRSHDEIYSFSLPPWHLNEIVASQPMGKPFPANQRISRLIPGDGRMWTPSIYAGTLVGLALLCRLVDWRNWFRDPWLGIAVGSLALAMGHFGIVWWLQQVTSYWDETSSAAGGLYWMLVDFVPGYDSFRYPAKWLPFFAIAASMLAAAWIKQPFRRAESIVAMTMLAVSLIAAACCQWFSNVPDWLTLHSQSLPTVDEYWGPLDMAAGFLVARNAWLVAAALTAAIITLRLIGRKNVSPRWPMLAIICIAMLDCSFHAQTLLPSIDMGAEMVVAQKAMKLRDRQFDLPSANASAYPSALRSMRTQTRMWPSHWLNESADANSTNRALDVAVAERAVWLGRWHLAERQALFNGMVSVRSQTMAEFWQIVPAELRRRSKGKTSKRDVDAFWKSFRRQVGIDTVCHIDARRTQTIQNVTIPHVVRVQTDRVAPVRVFDKWIAPRSMETWLRSLGTETGTDCPAVAFASPNEPTLENEPASSVQTNPDGTLSVQAVRPCVLERSQFQDGNWKATASQQMTKKQLSLTVLPSRHFNQAVWLPPGKWLVKFRYRPWWLAPSIVVTLLSWTLFALLVIGPSRLRGRLQRLASAVG